MLTQIITAFMLVRVRIFLAFFLIVITFSCSTQRNTLMTRTYHQITAKYNTFFNGRESYRSGVRKTKQQFRYDYNKILPVFLYTDPDIARSVTPEMDRAISKASKIIDNKSITAKPKEGGGLFAGRNEEFYQQNEYNRWVRESYLLAGKAHFQKHDYIPATQAFIFIVREFSMNDVRHEAKVWLARSYSERGMFNEARLTLNEMLDDPDFPSLLHFELYSTLADFYLKQNQPDDAIFNLERTLEYHGDKERRIRHNYILAQLYERTGRFSEASDYYSQVIKMNPSYEMVFNARISQAGVVQAGGGAIARLINELEKMFRDEKNRDFQDQIYYALGNIYLRNNDVQNAIRHYSLSAGANGTNPGQKAVTYLALADIYFELPDYVTAQAYYDSAVLNMTQGFPDRQAIIEKNELLTELADNIKLYELEDSVQVLAAMSEADRNRKIDDIIAGVREEEAEARRQEQLAQQTPQYRAARTSQSARRQAESSGSGNWYFYNQSAVTFGQNEFEALWGERRLEDNWRRSDKQVLMTGQPGMLSEESESAGEEEVETADVYSREFYMKDIPLTDQAMEESHRRLQEALFNMGMIFKDDMQDYESSIEAYQELVRRYPEGDYTLPALYNLHNLHMIMNDYSRADSYKDLIVSGYPGSPYASVLTNPDFYREYEQQLQEAERYYEETYKLFRENKFAEVTDRALYASVTWPESHLIPRFEYLKTLSYGSGGNIPLFREMLTDYISTYPETEMADDARRFIVYLEDDYPETIQKAEVAVIQDIYSPPREGEHYFVIIVDNRQDLINRMVFNIVNFNVDHFPRLNLNVSSETFSTNYQLLRVDGLPDIPVATDYLKKFSVSDEVYSETERDDFPLFIISPENYNLFMQDKNIASYMNFFEDEYLNLQ